MIVNGANDTANHSPIATDTAHQSSIATDTAYHSSIATDTAHHSSIEHPRGPCRRSLVSPRAPNTCAIGLDDAIVLRRWLLTLAERHVTWAEMSEGEEKELPDLW